MQPTIWELMQTLMRLESEIAALRAEVGWLTWAFRWLIGLQASTAGAAVGVAFFSWRSNNKRGKDVNAAQRAGINMS